MKKLYVFVALLVVASLFAGCAPKAAATEAPAAEAPKAEAPAANTICKDASKECIVLLTSALGDKSFTDSAHRGLTKASQELGYEYVVVEAGEEVAKQEAAYVDILADPSVDFVVNSSSDLMELQATEAPKHPEKKFIQFDNPYDFTAENCKNDACKNVYAVTYKQNEGSFILGYWAGLMSPNKTIGAVGGKEIQVIADFMVGYVQGAGLAGVPEANVLIQYAGSWNDPAKGKEIALAMYQQGADFVYQVAGGTGPGIFQAAVDFNATGARKVWALGVDSDQAVLFEETNPEYTAVIATSMLKNVDNSLFRAFKMIKEGTMKWGTNENLGIAEGGVGLAYNKYYEALTPADVKAKVAAMEADVLAGKVQIATVY